MFVPCISHLTIDPHLSRRALSNREKTRFCPSFVSLVSYPLTRLTLSEFNTVLASETEAIDSDPWHRFLDERRRQFMAMSVYIIPVDEVQKIIREEFKALVGLFDRSSIRLDTSGLSGDEEIVYCDEESDRYMECWRRVSMVYGSCGAL